MKAGIYLLEGNLVEYEGGDEAYDVDAALYFPVELLEVLGEYQCSFEEYYAQDEDGWVLTYDDYQI